MGRSKKDYCAVSLVRLLPKSGKALTQPADFRPISLTSCIGKVLERLLTRRLTAWCDRHHILQPEQSAFHPRRDAQEQVTLLTQRAVQTMNEGLVTAVAALDVAKAFDSVWHAGLVRQCIVDLPTGVARWVAAFLRDRTAAVMEDGFVSRRCVAHS